VTFSKKISILFWKLFGNGVVSFLTRFSDRRYPILRRIVWSTFKNADLLFYLLPVACFAYTSTLMMGAVSSFETSMNLYKTTRRHTLLQLWGCKTEAGDFAVLNMKPCGHVTRDRNSSKNVSCFVVSGGFLRREKP
jgi:hypothetical protein